MGPNLELSLDLLRPATEYIIRNAEGVFIWVYFIREEVPKYARHGCTRENIFNFLESQPPERVRRVLQPHYCRIRDKDRLRCPGLIFK
jgi:hypothetical protein